MDQLGRPRFRLSCRDADWFGSIDRSHLSEVSPNNMVKVLHLDELSQENTSEILSNHPGMDDADQFLRWTKEKGIEDLLVNPQSLDMLAKAFAAGKRPESRTQVFDLACQMLLEEHNPSHQIANASGVGISELMNLAGKVCAMQLLSGAEGFTLPGSRPSADFPALQQVPDIDCERCRHVLDTRLFKAPSEGLSTPVHRQVAEFLAARFLAECICNGLPTRRILALITGHDGAIVSEFRGLSAWLAALSHPSRAELIERDPLGVALYGDVRGFSVDDKLRILDGLEREVKSNPWIVGTIQMNSRSGEVVSSAMKEHVRSLLTSQAQDEPRQSFALILVEMLQHGQPIQDLADVLLQVIEDGTWWVNIKYSAVEAFLVHERDKEKALDDLELLITHVFEGEVSDPDDSLLGYLLCKLYPERLSVRRTLKFLKKPKTESLFGTYKFFWTTVISEDLSNAQLAELLDGFVTLDQDQSRDRASWRWFDQWHGVFRTLLRSLLEKSKGEVNPNHFFDWLEIAGRDVDGSQVLGSSANDLEAIASWLTSHSDVQKKLFSVGLERSLQSPVCRSADNIDDLMEDVEDRLFAAGEPSDFEHWCLEMALNTPNPIAAKYLIERVARTVFNAPDSSRISEKAVENRIGGNSELLNLFHKRIEHLKEQDQGRRKKQDSSVGAARQRQLKHQEQIRKRQLDWRNQVQLQEEVLRNNRAPPALLYRLAKAYLGGYRDLAGDTPLERLRDLLGGDENLIGAVLEGFRGSIGRDDLPSVAEVIRSGAKGEIHYLSLAFLAGLEDIIESGRSSEIPLNEGQLRLALAIHYNIPLWPRSTHQVDQPPTWFAPLLQSRPELVSDVLVRTARTRLRSGSDAASSLYALAHSPDHAAVARLATLPLLASFPIRCSNQKLEHLSYLLQAVLLHCDSQPLLELVEKKVNQPNMNVAQKVYWLSTGLIVSPEAYLERLEAYVAGKERRIQHLAGFLTRRQEGTRAPIPRSNVAVLSLLIRQLGAFCQPFSLIQDSEEGSIVTKGFDAHGIEHFIGELASIPSATASEELENLVVNERLHHWRPRLIDAAYRQNAVRREAEFRHFNFERILQVLENSRPANAADLCSLTIDKLTQMAKSIRDGSTSDWRQYWNVDSYNRPQVPKPEDAGRDALLSDLKLLFEPLGIDAQPEGRYADDKRSDIRISYDNFNVPVEIKRSCHADLWSAIKTQLIAKYTRDPGAQGNGIYLVLWFGNTEHCRPTPSAGSPPKSALELEQKLREALSTEEQFKISICVVDASRPE